MLENHNLVDARYIDESHKFVTTLWQNKDDGSVIEEVIEADNTQTQWKEFMKIATVKDIEDSTAEWKRAQAKVFDDLVMARVEQFKRQWGSDVIKELPDEKVEQFKRQWGSNVIKELPDENIINVKDITRLIKNQNKDEDVLFKLKLNLLELESVKNSTTAFKKKLRKAKSLLECFSMVNEVHKD